MYDYQMSEFRVVDDRTHLVITEILDSGREVPALRFAIEEGSEDWVATFLRDRGLGHLVDRVRSRASAG